MRRDAALAAVTAAVLALLLTVVAWRPTLDHRGAVILLYSLGTVFEAAGVLTIAVDLLAARRRSRNVSTLETDMARSRDGVAQLRAGAWPLGIAADVIEALIEATERHAVLRATVFASRTAAWTGFGLLLLGVLVGAAANILSATG